MSFLIRYNIYGEVSHLIKKSSRRKYLKLLETVAGGNRKSDSASHPLVSQVDLTIKKPGAPIGLPLIPYQWRSAAAGIPLISRSAPIWGQGNIPERGG